MALSFWVCQHQNWGRLIWYACKTGASLLFLTSYWVHCCLYWLLSSGQRSPSCSSWLHKLPCTPSLMCHMPVCHDPGHSQTLEPFKWPSLAPGTTPSSSGCLPRASRFSWGSELLHQFLNLGILPVQLDCSPGSSLTATWVVELYLLKRKQNKISFLLL